jgi:hypothetical protein
MKVSASGSMTGPTDTTNGAVESRENPRHAGWMWLSDSHFSPHQYTVNAAGLTLARTDLGHRDSTHAAFAKQSDITPAWQRWIDRAGRDAREQRAVVRYLTLALDTPTHAGDNERSTP